MHYLDALDNNVMSRKSLEQLHAKPGRPPRASQAASVRLEIRLTPNELALFTRAAGDKPVGTWLRDAGLRAAKRGKAK